MKKTTTSSVTPHRLWVHAVLVFLAMPGMVAYALPLAWSLRHEQKENAPLGLLLCLLGTTGLLACVAQFLVKGEGTLAPWKPPQVLVTTGPYCWSRNPMYLFVCVTLVGWALTFGSKVLIGYALVMAAIFHARIVYAEEPWLKRTFPEQWAAYQKTVPRWFWLRPNA